MKKIAFINLKGGSGKTTSAAYIAHACAKAGLRVLVVDADGQGSLLRWSETADWDIPTIALPTKTIHKNLEGVVPLGTDVVIIDTPPLEEHAGVVYSALRAANIVVIPMAPTMMEVDRLNDVFAAVEEVNTLREEDVPATVLLNRTVANATSTKVVKEAILESGRAVCETNIPRRESYAQAFGGPIRDLGKYDEAAIEILGMSK